VHGHLARARRGPQVLSGTPVAVSVLLPARDAAATIAEALSGLLAQRSAPPFEIVAVDDASTDGTGALLAETARQDPRVRVLPGLGRGLVAALELGRAACAGELIARMDADDLVHPDRLRLQAEWLAGHPEAGAVGSLVELLPRPLSPGLSRLERWLNEQVSPEQCRAARFVESPLVHPSLTFRRAALEAVGGYRDAGWAEDWDLVLRLFHAGFAVGKVPEVLLSWRDSPGRLTRTGAAYAAEQMVRLRAHHLANGPLARRPFDLWGAGPTGKRLLRALEPFGLRPRRVFDIDPRKQAARGVRVQPARELPGPSEALLLCAVGAAGARETIRAAIEPLGFQEERDFLFAA
jgi:cellulose synthase/poly-beta-1,6-N-acetylglucosamine synthase-like glycosyltransferase